MNRRIDVSNLMGEYKSGDNAKELFNGLKVVR